MRCFTASIVFVLLYASLAFGQCPCGCQKRASFGGRTGLYYIQAYDGQSFNGVGFPAVRQYDYNPVFSNGREVYGNGGSYGGRPFASANIGRFGVSVGNCWP